MCGTGAGFRRRAPSGVIDPVRRARHIAATAGETSAMKTRAAVARQAGAKLSLEIVNLEGPRAGEVLVEINATGICHTDEFTLSGGDPEGIFPSILCHDGAGGVA